MRRVLALLALLASAPACSGSDEPLDSGESWQPLLSAEWELPAGTEGYRCVRTTLDREVAIGALRARAPQGTHHTLLGIDDEWTGADGVLPCTPADVGQRVVYASGVGTDPFTFPEGVGLVLPAGARLVLNLHLFNATASPLGGTSGVDFVAATALESQAEVVLMGPVELDIPPKTTTTESGRCTQKQASTLFAILPHMHQLGRHFIAAHAPANGPRKVLLDLPYDFDEQRFFSLGALALAPGDAIEVECEFDNTGSASVGFGFSSDQEMCFAIAFRHPALGEGIGCSE